MIASAERLIETVEVPLELGRKRFDQIAATLFSEHSRSRIQQWIKDGELRVDGQVRKPKDKLIGGETLQLDAALEVDERWEAEPVELDVVYADDDIIVIDKPAGLVVHPGAGTPGGTLLNGLLYHYPELAQVPRAGIVHRLDKDTTGLMVVARSLTAHTSLVNQLQTRRILVIRWWAIRYTPVVTVCPRACIRRWLTPCASLVARHYTQCGWNYSIRRRAR